MRAGPTRGRWAALTFAAIATGVGAVLLRVQAPVAGPAWAGLFGLVVAALGVLRVAARAAPRAGDAEDAQAPPDPEGYRELIGKLASGVVVYDVVDDGVDFRVRSLNAAAERITGVTAEEVARRRLWEVFPALEDAGLFDVFREVWATGTSATHPPTRYSHGGRTSWVSHRVHRIGDDRIVAVFDDITERVDAERALQVSEETHRLMVDTSQEAIFVLQDGYVRFPNARALEVSGYSKEELQATPVVELLDPEDRDTVVEHMRTAPHRPPAPTDPGFRIRTRSGATRWLVGRSVPIAWEGRPATLNFVNDVTDARDLEHRFRHAQKMEAVGVLAAGVAHDFNNLLTAIAGNTELLRFELPPGTPALELLEEISGAAESAASLTGQLLAFSRRQMLRPRVVEVNALLQEVAAMLRRLMGEDVDVRFEPGAAAGHVCVDPTQLEQVVVNLGVNARDAMPEGGTLTIGTANLRLDETYVRTHVGSEPGEYVLISVSDTGVGIAEELRSQVFEPFFTTKERSRGTGLGLSTADGIVRQSGGHIELYSELGRGSTFKVYLPRAETESGEAAREASADRGDLPGGSETVLLVEDSREVRSLARRILEAAGYTVLEASRGDEALLLSERFSGRIELLLTDVVMPEMNGREVAARVLHHRPDVRVLYMSGYTDDAIVQHGVLDPDVALLQKPFGPADLLPRVREVLAAPPFAAA